MTLNELLEHLRDLIQQDPERGHMPVRVTGDCGQFNYWPQRIQRGVEDDDVVCNGNTIDIEIGHRE